MDNQPDWNWSKQLKPLPLVDESIKVQTRNTYRELVKLGRIA